MIKGEALDKLLNGQRNANFAFVAERAAVDEEARTVEVAISSEIEVERWYGIEILDHSPGAVDLTRLNNGAAVLLEHGRDEFLGKVDNGSARVDADRKLRARLKFGENKLAADTFPDVVSGVREKISVAYEILEVLHNTEGERDVYRVTKWRPFEVSFVSIPADDSVGVGRSLEVEAPKPQTVERNNMENENKPQEQAPAVRHLGHSDHAPEVDLKETAERARKEERSRVAEIDAVAKEYGGKLDGVSERAAELRSNGGNPQDLKDFVLRGLAKASQESPALAPEIGLEKEEAQRFSLVKAINARAAQDWRTAPFEKEVIDATEKKFEAKRGGFMLPYEVITAQRDLSVATGSAGGYTVPDELQSSSIIELLRNKMLMLDLGVEQVSGLVGNVEFPKHTGASTVYDVAEGAAVTQSDDTFGQLVMTPKTLGARTGYSRSLLLQSAIGIEQFVRNSLMQSIAVGLDYRILNGTGNAGQARGILNTTGIGTSTIASAGDPTWAETLEFMSDVETANALMGTLAYVTTPAVKVAMMAKDKGSSQGFVWTSIPGSNGRGDVAGYRAEATNQMPANGILFGNFSDVILGLWGAMEILVDPYTSSDSGTVKVTAFQSYDVGVKHAGSFSKNA